MPFPAPHRRKKQAIVTMVKPITSIAALTAQPLAALPPYGCGVPLAGCERHAGPGFGGTIADRTHLVGGGVLDAP